MNNIYIYILEAVRMVYKEMTENKFAEYASKWLAQATVRIQRQKNEEKDSMKINSLDQTSGA